MHRDALLLLRTVFDALLCDMYEFGLHCVCFCSGMFLPEEGVTSSGVFPGFPLPSGLPPIQPSGIDKQQVLDQHNELRRSVSASNMNKLVLQQNDISYELRVN